MKRILFITGILLIAVSLSLFGQNTRKDIRSGNRDFREGDFQQAELKYRKALEEPDKNKVSALFNLGGAQYRQENYEAAQGSWAMVADQAESHVQKSEAAYNLGNSLMKSQDYEKAVALYKEALRKNPGFEDARYNLEYAKKMLQQQDQQNQDQQNQDQQNQDQQNQDQQNQDQQNQDQQNQDQQNQDQQGQDQQEQQQQEQQQQEQQISKEDAQRMLEALQQSEKETMEKLNRTKMNASKVRIEKDW